jgi:flagellar basal-body rod protein FlgC
MSLFEAMTASASGMTAERLRMEVGADNLANANTTRTEDGGPYMRKVAVLEPRNDQKSFPDISNISVEGSIPGQSKTDVGDGVRVTSVEETDGMPKRRYLPDHPDANEEGYVLMPNVDPMEEMVDLMGASRAYEANVSAIESAKGMYNQALRIMQ